ncbi:SNF2-related protein [Streptomyces griseofuscus]|uniref:SNF2-related protein n=1 Tax=Streptomyces griseofuscus TaxID=146922 RepID=UPI0033FD015F
MQITNAADRLATSLDAKSVRRPWNPDLHPRDSKGRFVETGGIARLWGGGMARVLRALGGRDVLVENLATHQRSTVNASRLTMVARPDGSAPTRSKRKVRDEDERRVADGRRGTGLDADDPGDHGDTPNAPHEHDDEGNAIGEDREGEDHGTGPDPEDDEPEQEAPPAARRRDPNRRFKTLDDVRAHWASGKLRTFTQDPDKQESHNKFMAGLMDKLGKPQLSRNGHFLVGQMTVRGADGREHTGWGVMHTDTGVRLTLASRKAEALDFANRMEGARVGGEQIDWNDPDSFARLNSPEGRSLAGRLAAESRAVFTQRAAKKREGATARTRPAAPTTPEQQAAQRIAAQSGAPAANVAVGHVGSPAQPFGDERGRPRNDAELREFWKRGGSDDTPASQRDVMRRYAGDPKYRLYLADHRGFAIVEDTSRNDDFRYELRASGTGRSLSGLGPRGIHGYGNFADRDTADRFALYLGSHLRDSDGRTVDWGGPRLNAALNDFRDKDGQRSRVAIWQLAGQFDRDRGVNDSAAARFGRRRDERDEENRQDPETAPETPDTGIPDDDETPRPAAGQQRDEQEEHGERVHGAGEGVLGDVPAEGAGRARGDDAAGDVLRAGERGDRGADRRVPGRLPGADGAGGELPGRDREREHGDDAGPGEGPARDGVRPAEGGGDGGQGDAEGQPAEDHSRVTFGSDEEEQRAPQYQPPEDGRSLVPTGVGPRVKANIAAIEVLRRLEQEHRPATAAEQETLARWSGWGATPQVFVDEPKPEFAPLQRRLRELLTDDEWDAAKANTLNAHYTDPAIVREVWKAVQELGFDGGNVLEPGSGSGNYIGYAPESAHITGVELDPITAGISKALYPHADIRNEGFERTRAADGTFDMSVGNVPFGDYQVVDLRHNKGGHNIHNHFILKSLDLTRPGGLVAVVTSRFTMDGSTPRAEDARMEMARKADLVGAVRLPTGAHRRTAGTDVVTDLLIFRRREKDKEFTSGRLRNGQVKEPSQRKKDDPPMWVHSARVHHLPGQEVEDGEDPLNQPAVHVNPYFLDNPTNVLGEMAVGHGMYGPGELRVDGDGTLDASLSKALDKIVARAKDAGLAYVPDTGERRRPEMLPEGSNRPDGHVQVSPDGTFTQVRDGMVTPFEVPGTQVEEATQLLGLRDAMKALIAEESRPDADEALIETLRGDLKARYDKYHAQFGALNRFDWATRKSTDPETGQQVEKAYRKRPPMGGLLTRDPTMAVVLSLDSYDADTGTSTPAAIFGKRQSRHRSIAERASNPEDAMAIVMEQRGTLDTNTLAQVMGVTPQVARERLLAARSTDPETGHEFPLVFEPHNGGDLVPAADYLSGNVRKRLEEAQALAAEDPRFDINVKQLESVLPPDISPGEIDAPMGASWLGGDIVQSFLQEKLNTHLVRVSYHGGSLWKVDAPDGVKKGSAATEVWGTGDFNAIKLAEAILTNGRIRVTYKDDDGKSYVDEEATAAAQTKADELRDEFQDWLWATPGRSELIKKLYNDTHNNLALRSYDGQRRTMPGLATWFTPHAHQHSAVARMVNEPAVLLAHEVGAGKTAEMTMGVMELRRLGLINKAAIVVPNHMLQQFHDEFAELYPESAANGRILSASSEDLQGRKRREFIARVATGDYDAVILTQNAFESIPMRPEVQLDYVKREKKHLEEALRRQKEQDELDNPGKSRDSRMVKEIQNRLKKLEAKITAKVESSKDTAGLYFEDTGIDYVVVDEAHHYKNLTTNSSIPGAAIEGANRASDLDMKLEYLRKNTKSGRVVTFATATPISNSVTEAHTMLRYLRPDLLEAAKVRNFDDFASTYGKIVSGVELAADGSGFKEVSRFAAFRNMPELLRIWRTVADVKTSEDLAEYLDTPDVASGKAITISVEPTEQMLAYQDQLAARARAVKQGDVDPREDNMLKISSDGRKVSLDPRMVGLDEQGNKLPRAAENIARIYEQTKDAVYPTSKNNPTPHETPGGLQIVFLDMGTPKDPGAGKKKGKNDAPTSVEELGDSPFPAYQELKELLISQGVPAEKIRFIHEAKNDAEKARLFADARNGKIAVLVGSTSKMGTGTNVQLRATALHHLDCPWRPADLEQRNGRIIRQGNANPEVAIFQYVTEQSFDGFSWQTVARKAKFIRQIMKGNLTDRTVEDIPDGVFNAEQVTAISTGNPHLLEQANVKASLAILKRKLKGHLRTIEGYKSTIHSAEKLREDTDKLVAQLRDVIARRKNTRGDAFNATIGKNDFTKRDEAAKALSTAAQAVLRQGQQDPYRSGGHPAVVIGRVGGIEVTARYRTAWGDYGRVHLVDIALPDVPRSRHSYQEEDLKKDSTLPITRLEDSLADVDKVIVRAESRLRQEERSAETARERVNRPFEQADELESAERRSKLIAALIREQGKQTTSDDAAREKRARLEALEHQLREARLAAGEDSGDVDDPAAAQDTDLIPRTPAPPEITTDAKGRPRVRWPDAEAKKAAKERERQAKVQRAREERGETALDPEQVRSDLASLRDGAPAQGETGEPEQGGTPAASPAHAPDTEAPDTGSPETADEGTTTLDPDQVRSDLAALNSQDDDRQEPDATDATDAGEADDAELPEEEPPAPEDVQSAEPQAPEERADLPPARPDTEPRDRTGVGDGTPDTDSSSADPHQAEDTVTSGGSDFPAVGEEVITPDGRGEVMAVNPDSGSVLVRAERGTRVHRLKDVTRLDGAPFGGNAEENVKEQQNARKIEQAATHEGVELSHGHRLRDLDMEAGHGTIVDRDGNTIGWVRARIGDDGRRYWWGQDAEGGSPADMQWHEDQAAQAGAAPIRAASIVRDGLDFIRAKYTGETDENGRPEQEKRRPITPDRAITEMTLTPAQVRELSKLTPSGEYADGTPIDTLPWNAGHRRYSPYSAQAGALAAAAREAAAQQDESTPDGRRNKKVLLGAARKLEFQQYDSARRGGTLPAPGEPDPYDRPYEPRPEEPDTDQPDAAAPHAPDEPEATPTPEAAPQPFATTQEWRRAMIPVDAAETRLSHEAAGVWSSDDPASDSISLIRRGVLDALAAQEDDDYDTAEQRLTDARESAATLLHTLGPDEHGMEEPLTNLLAAIDAYLPRHRATREKWGAEDEQSRRLDHDSRAQTEQMLRGGSTGAPEPAPAADEDEETEVLDPDRAQVGDYIRTETQDTAGNAVVREGYLLAEPAKVTATRDQQRIKAWRLYVGSTPGEEPSPRNAVTVLSDEKVERLAPPEPEQPHADQPEHTNTSGWKGPEEVREAVGEHNGKPVEVGETHVIPAERPFQQDETRRAVYLDGERIGSLLHSDADRTGGEAWRADHDVHGSVGWARRSESDNPAQAAAMALAREHDAPLLSFPGDRGDDARAEPIRQWAGVWAHPQPAGINNVFLDRARDQNRGRWSAGAEPWDARFWISTMANVDPAAQYDENTRRSLEDVPREARQFLTGLSDDLRSTVLKMGTDLRADLRPVLMDGLATRNGRKKARERMHEMIEERVEKAREAVREQIARARAEASQHGLTEQQAEDFLVSVVGGDNDEQVSYGIRGRFPEALRPLNAAAADASAYWSAFAGWAGQDDSSNWAGMHWENGRREEIGAPLLPSADPRTGTGTPIIGEVELPKGMRWARGSDLREGDIFHSVRHPRAGTTDVFDGMDTPQYVINNHRDGVEGRIRSVTLDSNIGGHDPQPDDHVIIVDKPDASVMKRARHRARTDIFTNWNLPVDDQTYELGGPDRVAELVSRAEVTQIAKDDSKEEWSVSVDGVEIGRITNPRKERVLEYDAVSADGERRTWHGKDLATAGLVAAHGAPEGREEQEHHAGQDDHDQREEQEEQHDEQHQEENGEQTDRDAERGDGGGGEPPHPGAPSPDDGEDHDRRDDDDDHRQPETDAADDEEEDEDENRDERRDRDRRRRRRDRDRNRPDGGLPNAHLPNLPNLPDRDHDGDDNGQDAGAAADAPARLERLRDRYRSGSTPAPQGSDPEEHADYLRRLADNETLALTPDGTLTTWSDDEGRTWEFGHAASGMHLANWHADGPAIGGQEGALQLAQAYENLRDGDGNLIDWSAPQLDRGALRAWRGPHGELLRDAAKNTRDDLVRRAAENNAPDDGTDGRPAALPDDTADLPDSDLAALHGAGLPLDDQRRALAEMDERDDPDSRVREAVPDTPPADEAERAARGQAMDDALRFDDTEVAEEIVAPRRATDDAEGTPDEAASPEDNTRAQYGRWLAPRMAQARRDLPGDNLLSDAAKDDGVTLDMLFGWQGLTPGDAWRTYATPALRRWFDRHGRIDSEQWARGERPTPDTAASVSDAPAYDPSRPRFRNVTALREHLRSGDFDPYGPHDEPWGDSRVTSQPWNEIADGNRLFLSPGKRLAIMYNPAADWAHWQVRVPGSLRRVINEGYGNDGHGEGFGNKQDAMRAAVALETIRDADGRPFPWDAPDVAERAAAFRDSTGRTLSEAMADALAERPPTPKYPMVYQRWAQRAAARHQRRHQNAAFGEQAASEGFTVPLDPATDTLRAGDEVTFVANNPEVARRVGAEEADQYEPVVIRGRLSAEPRTVSRSVLMDALGSDRTWQLPVADGTYTDADGVSHPFTGNIYPTLPTGVYRKPRPDELDTPEEHPGSERPEPPRADTAGRPSDAAPGSSPLPDAAPAEEEREPEAPAAPEPVGGRPAEWVKVSDLQLGDLVRVDGTTKRGTARTLAGYVVDGPKPIPTTRGHRAQEMYRVLIADTPDGRDGKPVWVMPDAAAARATRDDQFDGAPQTGADSDVLTGRVAERVPTDSDGRGLFPGSVVSDSDGNEGVVTGASANTVRARFGDSRSEDDYSPTSLNVTDGGAARPTGWTEDGHLVRTGNVVGDRAGNLLGTVEGADGDTATVATPDGMSEQPVADLRVIGDTADTDAGHKVSTIQPTSAGDVQEGDVLVRETPDGPRTARVTARHDDGEQTDLDLEDTTTGEASTLTAPRDSDVLRAQDADGAAPDLGPEDDPASDGEITSHEPAPAVDPVTGPTVDPQLSPEEREAIADRGQAPDADPDAEQAAARIANDLPVTPEQAAALADEMREGADPDSADGRAAQRAADHLDAAAGREPDDGHRPEPGTVGSVGVGDTITLPNEFDPDTMTAYRVVDVQDGPGGVRTLTVEDGDGLRSTRTLASSDPLYQLPEPEVPSADPDAEPRDPNPAPDIDRMRSDYADAVVRAVIDNAVQGTTNPGSIHQLREQIAQQLTPEALRTAMRRARNGALSAISDAGIEGDERAALVRSLRPEAARARTDAIRAALRTLDDLEPRDGEAPEDTARRAADLLRLVPEALRNRPAGNEPDADGPVGDAVAQHADDAVGQALQAAADGGPLTEERRAAIVAQLAARMAATREATAQRIAASAPAGQRAGVIAHVVAALIAVARKIVELVGAFLKALARLWQRSREGLRRMRERAARFRRGLVNRVRSWPESRRLRRLATAADLPEHPDGLPLGDRVAHWARLLPAPGRFGQVSRRARWYRPASRTSLAAGQLPPVQDGVRWAMDRAVDGGPGPQALRHLAVTRAAGLDVDTDVAARLSAVAPDLGDDPHGTVRHAAAYADTAERRLRDLEGAAAGGASDADLEIAAARVEAQFARHDADRLQRAYAAALPGAVRDTLAEIREMGPGTTATLVTTPDSDPAAVRALADIAQFVPRDWLSPTESRFIAARAGNAGAYDPASRTATVADLGDQGRRTAAHALLAHLQQHYPDLLAAQEAFHFTRTHSGRTGARRRTALDQLLARLFRDRAGHGDTSEIVPLALANLFSGDWYEDDDLRAFLLGLLATR